MTIPYLDKRSLYRLIDYKRSEFGLPCPFEPYLAAQILHITVRTIDFESPSLDGLLIENDGHYGALISASANETSRRFILSHEIAHYLLHGKPNVNLAADSILEWQANEGAAELLMPYRMFLRDIASMRKLTAARPYCAAEILAKKYGVSMFSVKIRFNSLACEIDECLKGAQPDSIEIAPRIKREAVSALITIN